MKSDATTVKEYLDSLPEDRRKALSAVRKVMRANVPKGVVETMNWGMIAYEVPLSIEPNTYNGQPLLYSALASQKNHMAVYLMSVYSNEKIRKQFEDAFRASGKKPNLGKSCVRFRSLDELPLDAVAEALQSCTLEGFLDAHHKAGTAGK